MEYGIVYLLTNPVMPGLVKIGMTTQEGIDKRMKELYTTGVPIPFECKFACKVKKSDCLKIEKALHKAFDPQRINQNREFFRINVEQAQAILELFHHEDVTEEVTDEIQNDLTDEDKAASTKGWRVCCIISIEPKISIPALATPARTRINNTRINGSNHAIARINNPLARAEANRNGRRRDGW